MGLRTGSEEWDCGLRMGLWNGEWDCGIGLWIGNGAAEWEMELWTRTVDWGMLL